LLIHLGGRPQTGNFRVLLAKCPRLKLILAHLALPHFEAWKEIKEEKNCFVDISGGYLNASLVRRGVKALGPDKVIFGSDAPVSLRCSGGDHSYEPILRWTRELPISDNDKEKIFHRNLEQLLP
jgi:predicted TIM-barrel fold metal-dependent hydrolase